MIYYSNKGYTSFISYHLFRSQQWIPIIYKNKWKNYSSAALCKNALQFHDRIIFFPFARCWFNSACSMHPSFTRKQRCQLSLCNRLMCVSSLNRTTQLDIALSIDWRKETILGISWTNNNRLLIYYHLRSFDWYLLHVNQTNSKHTRLISAESTNKILVLTKIQILYLSCDIKKYFDLHVFLLFQFNQWNSVRMALLLCFLK